MLQMISKTINLFYGEIGILSIMKDAKNGKSNKVRWIGEK